MNELTESEIQLRSWAPRRPSGRLERRILKAAAVAPSPDRQSPITDHPSPGFRLRWLAPATAALVLLCVLYNQRTGDSLGGSTNASPFVAMILSNRSVVAYLPSFQREQNGPPADTFEWTNGSGSTSSIRSLLAPKAQN